MLETPILYSLNCRHLRLQNIARNSASVCADLISADYFHNELVIVVVLNWNDFYTQEYTQKSFLPNKVQSRHLLLMLPTAQKLQLQLHKINLVSHTFPHKVSRK